MGKKIGVFLLLGIFISCGSKSEKEKAISKIPMKVDIERFDQKFAQATPKDLPRLKTEFPALFPETVSDSIWVHKMKDSLRQALDREVAKSFSDLTLQKKEIKQLFQHLKYYFPKFEPPKIITLVSEVDYRNRVIVNDSLLLISLDVYLGSVHKFYAGIYPYMVADFNPELIISDIAGEYAKHFVPAPKSRMFLAQMVYYGKLLYLKDLLIPFKTDAQKIKYTSEELKWARKNEDKVWRFFVERELLFSTNQNLKNRFIKTAPFSKFYLKLDRKSPAQIGRYIGWQIVRQFAEKNEDLTLRELLMTEAQTIFEQSNYKPQK